MKFMMVDRNETNNDRLGDKGLGDEGMVQVVKLGDKYVTFSGDSGINRNFMVLLHLCFDQCGEIIDGVIFVH